MIDDLDRKILSALRDDGRLSFRDLGSRVHLSPNATAERVRRLKTNGVIRGFAAVLNHASLGYALEAYIDVKLQPGVSAQSFESAIARIPGVVGAAIVTGDFDWRVRVSCRDQADLVRVIETLRTRAGAQQTNSAVICREIDVSSGLKLDKTNQVAVLRKSNGHSEKR